ncbi:DUF4327 family protein [Microcoleus sp. FACHB-831]|uniref:DUF4327 family protein n=1 Tax=Microcoleus sp. FACHB-831 TaxID=2692827 RepID=UPI0016866AE5|nr:DUF4327 family protein [Microcoleus sp. FACHB-831]MBD1920924.1 DUF4327 family protein [Microcoleus sp. FACHB-831]
MIQSNNQYSLAVIRDEVRMLVEKGVVSRRQRIVSLWRYIAAREWIYMEQELENSNFLLRDYIGDLIGSEEWDND